jgi:hypothetical protein
MQRRASVGGQGAERIQQQQNGTQYIFFLVCIDRLPVCTNRLPVCAYFLVCTNRLLDCANRLLDRTNHRLY